MNTPKNPHVEEITEPEISLSTQGEVKDTLDRNPLNLYHAIQDIPCPDFLRNYSATFFVKPEVSQLHLDELKKMLAIMLANPNLEFRPGDQMRGARSVLFNQTKHEYNVLCTQLGGSIIIGDNEILQGKANESFREIYPKFFGNMPAIWRSEDEHLIKSNNQCSKKPSGRLGW